LEDLCIDGEIIFKGDLKEAESEGVGWINLAEYRDQRRAFVSTVLNFRIP
jgi:hypothetical protein